MYPDNTSKGQAALKYAKEQGWFVFPCRPGTKIPLTEHGFKDATTDEAQIRAWWRRWPNANVGIATGKRSNLFVLDVDPDKGGLESLKTLEAEYEKLPEAAKVATPTGGYHYYFEYPADGTEIPNSVGQIGPGLDIRGEGGYVIAPPSDLLTSEEAENG